MTVLERLFSIGSVRKAIWQRWYPYLTKRLRDADVRFLNYAFESDPPVGLSLLPEDEADRVSIQLYHHVASQIELSHRDVLEVSCGHGGGASWITRAMIPKSYLGLDLNPVGIAFCQQRHPLDRLTFRQGDAQRLPFADGSFDAVINVEASHCYPDFPRFLTEVFRVLRPGGHFLYADFRFRPEIEAWENAIAECPMTVIDETDISEPVLRGMNASAQSRLDLVENCLPRFLNSLGRDFAGVPNSYVYDALKSGNLSYRSWCLQKT
ncbi:MAG: class I SAM-dependent methyltransferase [Verrucomicrobiae bacterium]|nr:class I SAM-dependent methyltransferase [Verrucomicrobiae bacterium]